jgi:hypothetical protein
MNCKGVDFLEAERLVVNVLNGSESKDSVARSKPSITSSKKKPASQKPVSQNVSQHTSKKKTAGASSSTTIAEVPPGELGRTLFPYHQADGHIAFFERRVELADGKKRFELWGPTEEGHGFQPNMDHAVTPRPLYGAVELLAAKRDEFGVVHEGTKSVHAHRDADLPGIPITSCCGAKSAKLSDWSPVKGRRVVIVVDHDDNGERYGREVEALTKAAGAVSVCILRLPDLPPKGDIVEWLAQGGTVAQFQQFLDAVPPPEPVPQLADLIAQIEAMLSTYICFQHPHTAVLIACWVVLSYVQQAVTYIGFLALQSPTPRCGKSKTLKLISRCLNGSPPILANVTAATIFRNVDPCQIIDEADRYRQSDKEVFGLLMSVLNVGFEAGAKIPRMDREGNIQFFDAFKNYCFSGIEGLCDTISDRAFIIRMLRSTTRMPRLILRKLDTTFAQIRRDLERWAAHNLDAVQAHYESLGDSVPELMDFDERYQDISESVLVIAELADEGRPSGLRKRVLSALGAIADRREPVGREQWFLAFLDLIDEQLKNQEDIFVETATLLELCETDETLSEVESGRALAAQLRNFDLLPRQNPAGLKRGYAISRQWFTEWRRRYPASEQSWEQPPEAQPERRRAS